MKTQSIVALLMVLAVTSQAITLLLFGHVAYLWVQGVEALAAAAAMFAYQLWKGRKDWPPLLPLGAIALTGGVKDLYVATAAETPRWIVVALLGSVVWFVVASVMMWRRRANVEK